MPPLSALLVWWASRPPAAGAAVMATGILSMALHLTGRETLSLVVLAMACVGWVALAADFVLRLLRERRRWVAEAETPGALTAVAATTVLGSRFAALGWPDLSNALLALAALLWPVLLVLVVRHWGRRMPGAVFLCCVATEGLAVLSATMAAAETAAWLARAGLVFFWLGLALYAVALTHFDPRQLAQGAGDHWISAGALAISALAGAKLLVADSARLYLWNNDDRDVLRNVTVVLLAIVLAAWLVLIVTEVVWPRFHYDVRRWSTVFPLGMTAAATLSASSAVGIPWLKDLGRVLVWVAAAAWLAVAVGAVLAARAEFRKSR
jgi:tellurite resistance protein TehA-like permease